MFFCHLTKENIFWDFLLVSLGDETFQETVYSYRQALLLEEQILSFKSLSPIFREK